MELLDQLIIKFIIIIVIIESPFWICCVKVSV